MRKGKWDISKVETKAEKFALNHKCDVFSPHKLKKK